VDDRVDLRIDLLDRSQSGFADLPGGDLARRKQASQRSCVAGRVLVNVHLALLLRGAILLHSGVDLIGRGPEGIIVELAERIGCGMRDATGGVV